jgi:Spy/CpxP family protein refolding chaperone
MAMRGVPGPVGMLVHTARSLELKDEQKTKLDAAEKSLKGEDASSRDEMKALHTDLAASVKAGKIEQAKIDADLAALEKAAKDRNDKEAAALNEIYAALEPAQRADVAKKVRERTEAREKKETERRAKMAERDKGDGGADGGRGERNEFSAQRRVERLVRDLDLDAEQQKKAQALAKDDPKAPTLDSARADAKRRGEALLAAFEKDGFDAKKLEAPDTKRARQGAEQEVKLVSALLPILKPEQREKLAARMEKQAQGGGSWAGGGPGGRGGPGGAHGGMPGMAGMGGMGGHRRTLNKHQSYGPDYDWFDDDEEEEMAGGGGAGGSQATPQPSASAAPAASASAPAK